MSAASISLLRLSPPLHHHHHHHHHNPAALLPHPLRLSFSPPLQKTKTKTNTKSTTATTCSYTPTPAVDRLISAASYFLPLFNGLHYGRFLFTKYPIVALPFEPLIPLLSLYHSVPYASFITFFGFYLGIVKNPSLSRYVRFNALQALVLDVLLVVPVLLQKIISPGRSGIVMKLTGWAHSGLFVFVVGCFLYGLVSSVLGKTPYLPLVAEAAGRQLE